MGLCHIHIYTSLLPNTLYGGQTKTKNYHGLANRYMGSHNQRIQNGEPSPAIFLTYHNFVFHRTPRTPDNMKNLTTKQHLLVSVHFNHFNTLNTGSVGDLGLVPAIILTNLFWRMTKSSNMWHMLIPRHDSNASSDFFWYLRYVVFPW